MKAIEMIQGKREDLNKIKTPVEGRGNEYERMKDLKKKTKTERKVSRNSETERVMAGKEIDGLFRQHLALSIEHLTEV